MHLCSQNIGFESEFPNGAPDGCFYDCCIPENIQSKLLENVFHSKKRNNFYSSIKGLFRGPHLEY